MYNTYIHLILLFNLDILTSGILFEYRLRCPDTADKWRENSDSYICHGDRVYHCMQDQDGRYVVFCASSIWIQPDYCPEFNAKASLIDVILCQGAVEGCPGNIYLSNTVYQYPSCFRTLIRSTTPSPSSDNRTVTRITELRYTTWGQAKPKNEKERASTVSNGVIPGIVVGIILPILVFLAIIFFVKRKRPKKNEKEAKSHVYESKSNNLKEEETDIPQSETVPFLQDSAKDDYKESRKEKEETFVIPKFYKDAIQILKEDGFIIIVGGPGSGKTTFVKYMVKENFTGFNVNYMKPKQTTLPELTSDKGDIVVWDDCFGVWDVCNLEESERTSVGNTVMSLIDNCESNENHKALICIDSSFVEKHLTDKFKRNIFDLSENYTQLEREEIRNKFDRRIKFGHISKHVGFPLLIKLTVGEHCPIDQSADFVKNPIPKLNENFDNLFQKDRDVYVTLVYVLCNTPSVNQGEIDWKAWVKLRDECPSKDDGSNNPQQKRSYDYSQLEEAKNLAKGRNLIYKNPKCIELNSTLLKYLEKTEKPDVYTFRHHFLAQLLLRFHIDNVGSKGILEVANKEVESVVKKLQSST